MERVELHEVVARAIARELWGKINETELNPSERRAAAAAIRVVLAEAERSISSVPHSRAWVPDAEGEARNRGLDEALAVLAGLVPPPPV